METFQTKHITTTYNAEDPSQPPRRNAKNKSLKEEVIKTA